MSAYLEEGCFCDSLFVIGVLILNMRQNMRQRRSFRRSKRHFWPKYAANHAAVPFIPPFKTPLLAQICGKTCGNAVHFAVQNGIFGPNMRQNMRRRRSFRRTLVRSTMKNGVIFRSGGKLGQICLIMLEKGTFRRLFNRANRAPLTNRAHPKTTWKKSLTNFQEITKNLLR